jgi:hypothetical protein
MFFYKWRRAQDLNLTVLRARFVRYVETGSTPTVVTLPKFGWLVEFHPDLALVLVKFYTSKAF